MSISLISLATPILPKEKLYPTPSMQDGLQYEYEFDLRLIGCELIQTAGRLLRLPQTAMATAQVLFQRYYYCKSFVKNNMEHYAMGAIFLSSKIEECPRRLRDVMNVFHHIKQMRTGKLIKPMSIDQQYNETKNQIIKAERRILKELGFCVHVKHPHKIISIYLTAMECFQQELIQKSWNYMNDSLRTDVFLRYKPEIVACACIYLSARELKIPLPVNPAWFTIFGASEQSLKIISVRLLQLYSHRTKSQEELEKVIIECRDKLLVEKQKIKETSANQAQPDSLKQNESLTNLSSLLSNVTTTEDAMIHGVSGPPIINANNLNIKINIINTTNTTTNSHIYHHHQASASVSDYHHLATKTEKYTNGTILHDIKREEANYMNIKESKKSAKRTSSKHNRSSSRSRSRTISPRHKKHKKVASRERRSRSRSTSPLTKHKKKKEHRRSTSRERHSRHSHDHHHHHSRSKSSKSSSTVKRSSSSRLQYQAQHESQPQSYPPPPSNMPMYMY